MSWAHFALMVIPALLVVEVPVEAPRPEPREPIGTVLGKTIYRDQLRQNFPIRDELFRLVDPSLQRYRSQHQELVEPTYEELKFAAEFFRRNDPDRWRKLDAEKKAELTEIDDRLADPSLSKAERAKAVKVRGALASQPSPDQLLAQFVVGGRKFNLHLYKEFGGGRILWQQAGVEAFDAHRGWLESLEERGDFSIDDAELRAVFYEYWTNEGQHRTWLSSKSENPQAFEEFLNPPWFPQEPKQGSTQ